MSRTRKDRPYWVRANDPKERKSYHHDHIIIHREKVGERKYIHTPESVERDEFGNVIYRVKEYSWNVPIYNRWVEYVGCTIDQPMTKALNWSRDGCYTYALDLGYGWPRHSAKKAVSQARRHNVRQQLHMAVRANGHHTDTDPDASVFVSEGADEYGTLYREIELPSWWDVDILENPLYAKNRWWD